MIENDLNMRGSLLETLKYEGFKGVSATNGRSSVQLAKEQHPALMLCDLCAQTYHGYETFAEFSHDPKTASIPVISLAVHSDEKAWKQEKKLIVKSSCFYKH